MIKFIAKWQDSKYYCHIINSDNVATINNMPLAHCEPSPSTEALARALELKNPTWLMLTGPWDQHAKGDVVMVDLFNMYQQFYVVVEGDEEKSRQAI